MSLFSFLRKNKQESSDDTPFVSRAEGESNARRSRRKQANAADVKDPALPEKKRARRRLIGAIALVLAAIIGLPMILDSEPKPLAEDVAIRIPSKDKAEPVRETPPPSPNLAATTNSLDPNEEVVEPAAENTVQQKVAPQSAAASEAVAAAPTAKSQAVKPPLVAEKIEKAPTTQHAAKEKADTPVAKVEKPDDSARALAMLEGKSDPTKAVEKKSGKFVIQVAALASKEKVAELQAKLKDAGIKSYTQKVATNSGDRIRIRVGPFASKDEADRMKVKVGKLGLNGTLIPA
jgi:DedD protein